jgi:hypothetical protein
MYKTTKLISRHYWWPRILGIIKSYVEGCTLCQQIKVNTHPQSSALQPIKSDATRPFQIVLTDFITDLPKVNGFKMVIVVVNHRLSKGVISIPCSKNIDTLGTADLYLKHMYTRFNLPNYIISDRGL